MVDWASVASEFEPEGSLRDIYVFDTTLEDWQSILDAVRRADLQLRFFSDGGPAQPPERIADVFAIQQHATASLHVIDSGVQMNCHFFTQDEVEFDIDPREISGPVQFDVVVRFMKLLADATQKVAVLTPENAPSAIIMRYPAA